MAIERFVNGPNPSDFTEPLTTLAAPMLAGAPSITVSVDAGPSTGQFRIVIGSQRLLVTGKSGVGNTTWAVTPAIENTSAAAASAADGVFPSLTAGAIVRNPRSMTTLGDMEYLDANGAPARLAAPTDGAYVVSWATGVPSWTAGLSMAATRTANTVLAGPATGSPAAPTFRALVAADIPDLSATYATPGAVVAYAQPLDEDLTAIAALTGTGLARRTGSNTWALDTNTYLTSAVGSSSTTQLLFNNAGVVGGSANLTWFNDKTLRLHYAGTPSLAWGEVAFTSSPTVELTGNVGAYTPAALQYQETFIGTGFSCDGVNGADFALDYYGGTDIGVTSGLKASIFWEEGTGTGSGNAIRAHAAIFADTVPYLNGIYSELAIYGGTVATFATNFYAAASYSGSFPNLAAFYAADLTGSATNPYMLWKAAPDTNGNRHVWRVNAEGIVALYNKDFGTIYTPGATNYERGIGGQWASNVYQIGTEASGTGTLRGVHIIGASLVTPASLTVGSNLVTLSGSFTTTGAFNPTFAIPSSSTWTFPSGGGTLLTSTDLAAYLPLAGGTMTGTITSTIGTITASTPAFSATQTWNAVGTTFTGWKFALTNTASASASKPFDITIGGTSVLSIGSTDGNLIVNQQTGAISTSMLSVRYAGTSLFDVQLSTFLFRSQSSGSAGVLNVGGGNVLVNAVATTGSNIQFNANTSIINEAANSLAIRNSTNATKTRFYNTFTTLDTAGEWFTIDWQTTANVVNLQAVRGSSSGTARVLTISYGGTQASPVAAITVPITSGSIVFGGGITLPDAGNIVVNATTGTMIGTAASQKLSLWGVGPVVQPTAVADAAGGALIDAEARTALNALLARMRTIGAIAA